MRHESIPHRAGASCESLREGQCHRVFIRHRKSSEWPLVVVECEDDGNWFESMSFDIGWLPEFEDLMAALYCDHQVQDILASIAVRRKAGTYFK